MLKKITIGILAAAAICCAGGTIKIKGSDTMLDLSKKWGEKFMASHSDITVDIAGGGSSKGISALIDGSADLCNASRPMKATEREKMKERHSSLGVEFKVAKDGVGILVNASNPVSDLSLSQVRGILSGKITNWKDVGGKDGKITVYTRESTSGTYGYLRDIVMSGKDFAPGAQTTSSNDGQVAAAAKDPQGIAYGDAHGNSGVKSLQIKKSDDGAAVALSEETVKKETYPLTRFLYVYAPTRPTGITKDYIDWIMGSEGQAVAAQLGFVALK